MTETNQRVEALENRLFRLFLSEWQEAADELLKEANGNFEKAALLLFENWVETAFGSFVEVVADQLQHPTPLEDHATFVAGLCYDGEEAAEKRGDLSSAAAWASAAYGLEESF